MIDVKRRALAAVRTGFSTPAGRRLAAAAIDAVVVAAVLLAVAPLGGSLDPLAAATAFVAYHTALPWLSGSTVGKAVLGLRLRHARGWEYRRTPAGLMWAAGRATVGYLLAVVVGLPVALMRRGRPCIHDRVFRSRLVVESAGGAGGWLGRLRDYAGDLERGAEAVRPRSVLLALVRWLTGGLLAIQGAIATARRAGSWVVRHVSVRRPDTTPAGRGPGAGREPRSRPGSARVSRSGRGTGRVPRPALTVGLAGAAVLAIGFGVMAAGLSEPGDATSRPGGPGGAPTTVVASAPSDPSDSSDPGSGTSGDPSDPTSDPTATSSGGDPRPTTTTVAGPAPGGSWLQAGPAATTVTDLVTDAPGYTVGQTIAMSARVSGEFTACTWTVGGAEEACTPAAGPGAGSDPVTVTGSAPAGSEGDVTVSISVSGPGGTADDAAMVSVGPPPDTTPPSITFEPSSIASPGAGFDYHWLSVTIVGTDPESPVTSVRVIAAVRWTCAGSPRSEDLGVWIDAAADRAWVGGEVGARCGGGGTPPDPGSVRADLHGEVGSAGGPATLDTTLSEPPGG